MEISENIYEVVLKSSYKTKITRTEAPILVTPEKLGENHPHRISMKKYIDNMVCKRKGMRNIKGANSH